MFVRVTCSPRRCLTSLMICDSSHEMVEQNGHRIINGRTSVLGNVCALSEFSVCLFLNTKQTLLRTNNRDSTNLPTNITSDVQVSIAL